MKFVRPALVLAPLAFVLGSEAHGASIANNSFEANVYTTWPGYISGNGGTITGWTAADNTRAGINSHPPTWVPANTSPFANNGVIPNGAQAAFIQVATATPTNTLSTTITGLTPGQTYRVTWGMTARNNGTAANQRPNGTVTVGAASVGFQAAPVEAANSRTLPYRNGSLVFTATGATEVLTVGAGLIAGQADSTLVIDNFQVLDAAPTKWLVSAWNDDATSGIIPGLTYTHAYNLASAAATTINGVLFSPVAGANPAVIGSFSTTGWIANTADAANNLNSGGSALLADEFVYGGAAQTAQTITLDGLTPGTPYRLTLYGVAWQDASAPNRSVTADDGSGDTLTINEHQFGVDNGMRVDFEYTPSGTSKTFTFNPTSINTTFHLYGFANASVIPEPGAAALTGATALLLLRRRRR